MHFRWWNVFDDV